MGKCAEFFHGITKLGNGRAGSECVRFRQGTGTGLRDDRLIRSRIHGDTGLGGAAFGDPPVGQGDPDVKPGAFLPGLPLFLRSRREDHGLGGYVLNGYVWVLDPESPGLTGTHRDSPGLTGTHRDSPGLTGTHRDSPVAVSPWAQGPPGSAATEPRHGGAARRSLRFGNGSRGRTLRDQGMGTCAEFIRERR